MQTQYITIWDFLLMPIYLVAIYVIAFGFRRKYYPLGHPLRPYFISGLTAKIIGALLIGFIYQYYYGGGDTLNYFHHSLVINSAFTESPDKWFNLLLHIPSEFDGSYSFYTDQMEWYKNTAAPEYFVCKITAFINLFTFNTYLNTSIIFAALSFTGVWALFRAFLIPYPSKVKALAICVLYIPSMTLWGSGIFKDTICVAAIGWLTYCTFRVLILRDISIKNIIIAILCFYSIAIAKKYILIAFLPALALWVTFNYLHKIKSKFLRFTARMILIPLLGGSFIYIANSFPDELGKYSLGKLGETANTTRDWIHSQSSADNQGSAYDLGEIEPSAVGMLKKFPFAVNVTLFRPYVWETHKLIQWLNALEALAFMLLTIKLLLYVGPIKVWRAIADDPNIQFCLVFTLIFAFSVGISSFNFGALSRYRIPCLPFYAITIILIYYKYYPPHANIFSLKTTPMMRPAKKGK
jgi:hypothetical protein